MFQRRLPQAVCLLSLYVCLLLAYEDNIEVNYSDNYLNEISELDTPEAAGMPEPTPTVMPCRSKDLTKWDKLFSMLENSQMRENMLLQYTDDIIKMEIAPLREELNRCVAQSAGSCEAAVESAGKTLASQLEDSLKETLEHLKTGDQISATAGSSIADPGNLESMLQQLLFAAQAQAAQLSKLESSCFSNPGAGKGGNINGGFPQADSVGAKHWEQEVTPLEEPLVGTLVEVRQTKAEMEEVLRSMRQRNLPAGCEMALLFPMRSGRIFTSVLPDAPLSISSFTACMWLKPTVTANKTVLLSYGNRRNPYEIQLLLGQTSALLTIGGETHLVEARGVVTPGEWLHLCGTWSSVQGMATLWAGGQKVASTPGVAEGHVLPDGGALQLGQERNGCCSRIGLEGFETGFNRELAFAGKMTGVNMWDRVLSEEEISQLALQDGQGCMQRGNIVAWGMTEMVPHAGAQFVF